MGGSRLLLCNRPLNPIPPAANPCCNQSLLAYILSPGAGNAAPRFHQGRCWFSDNMAARSARTAIRAHAADWRVDGLSRKLLGRTGVLRRISRGTSKARVDGRPQHPARRALGVARGCGGETAVREGLVGLQPDLILSSVTPTTAALLQQTRTIPIVFATVS